MSETKMPVLCGEECVPCLSPSFWWLLTTLGTSWLMAASLQFLPLLSHGLLPCVSLSVSSHGRLIMTSVIRFRAHSNPMTSP